ncbi:MAG: sulfate/molybdate ABC transporter ATP-binding protein [Leptospiraceae bacterium]|nr:sulfate/molybdate ABC transporter ATP-binding protein [Leptospiraceae bacterium]MCP5512215.1 sulfate/molybdate ABC transporter ATP-binding protein [Leptospiraceae bacterium]
MNIEIRNISKKFDNYQALNDLNFSIHSGELISLLGPSGSGKTTLLRILSGLETSDKGDILIDGQVIQEFQKENRIGFVFQHYALFKNMTVEENIGFPMKIKKKDKSLIQKRVRELLELIHLPGMEKRYPSQLSGGQKQRIALARALASDPKILLLDEPFGALDANVRKGLRKWLKDLHKEIDVTTVMVTHDQEEAFEVSDRVAILNKGLLQQIGTPTEVFHSPINPFVIQFLGNVNIFHVRVESGKTVFSEIENSNSKIYIRPFDWKISKSKNSDEELESRIEHINSAGFLVKLDLTSTSGNVLNVDIPYDEFKSLNIKVGDFVFLSPRESRIFQEDYII